MRPHLPSRAAIASRLFAFEETVTRRSGAHRVRRPRAGRKRGDVSGTFYCPITPFLIRFAERAAGSSRWRLRRADPNPLHNTASPQWRSVARPASCRDNQRPRKSAKTAPAIDNLRAAGPTCAARCVQRHHRMNNERRRMAAARKWPSIRNQRLDALPSSSERCLVNCTSTTASFISVTPRLRSRAVSGPSNGQPLVHVFYPYVGVWH